MSDSKRKFRVRWWMWALDALAMLGYSIWGALTDSAPRAIFGAVFASAYALFAGLLLADADEDQEL